MEVSDHPHKGELYIVSIKKLLHSESSSEVTENHAYVCHHTIYACTFIWLISHKCNSVDREYCNFSESLSQNDQFSAVVQPWIKL